VGPIEWVDTGMRTPMNDDEAIRDVFTGWVEAIRSRNLDGVLANHDADIVMFDVPPPYDGVRGIDDYRECWAPFFDFIAQGAEFTPVEVHVVAGTGVAFLYALLRCGTAAQFDENPDNRLRVTLGLRKIDERWLIAHEHHSFPMTDTDG
jgi:uncharacterized protein (TIGR02246 family)